MVEFISSPNLPHGIVKSVLMGSGYDDIADALRRLGINVIELPLNSKLQPPIQAHADMSAYYCGSGKLILSKNIADKCPETIFPSGIKTLPASSEQNPSYPNDISLNACNIGNIIICNTQYTDPLILNHALQYEQTIINCKQGYAKCAVCILDERHIITADPSISAAAKKTGIEVLLIEPGFFDLPGYEYGFIGGSCFKVSVDTIAFTGTLDNHPNKCTILEFISNTGLEIIYLTDKKCTDVGSIIPLTEER